MSRNPLDYGMTFVLPIRLRRAPRRSALSAIAVQAQIPTLALSAYGASSYEATYRVMVQVLELRRYERRSFTHHDTILFQFSYAMPGGEAFSESFFSPHEMARELSAEGEMLFSQLTPYTRPRDAQARKARLPIQLPPEFYEASKS